MPPRDKKKEERNRRDKLGTTSFTTKGGETTEFASNEEAKAEFAKRERTFAAGARGSGREGQSAESQLLAQRQEQDQADRFQEEQERLVREGGLRAEEGERRVEALPTDEQVIFKTSEEARDVLTEDIQLPDDLRELQKKTFSNLRENFNKFVNGDLAGGAEGIAKGDVDPNQLVQLGLPAGALGGVIGGVIGLAGASAGAAVLRNTKEFVTGSNKSQALRREIEKVSSLSSTILSDTQNGGDPFENLVTLNILAGDLQNAEDDLKKAIIFNEDFALNDEYRIATQELRDARANVRERINGHLTLIKTGTPTSSPADIAFRLSRASNELEKVKGG